MKIIFIEPSFTKTHADDNIFPFGYACLGAILQREGHNVEYVLPAANRLSMQDVINHISKTDANLIGIGGLLPYLPRVIEFVEMIKSVRPDLPIVLGGPMVTYMPELVLNKTGANFCIAGEGEIALLKLVRCLEAGENYSNIPGLVFKKGGQISNNGFGEIMPLEDIPLPNWNDFPMEFYLYSGWYLPTWSRKNQERVFAWLLSRGCPMKCNFCASGCKARYKTIDQSIDELREIANKFDPDYLLFVDNYLMRNKKHTMEFCEAIIKNGFRFKFSITGRVNVVDKEMLSIMKKAGCQMVFYGLECSNNNILKFMKKGITAEQAIKAIRITKEAGIYPMVSIMFGQPGETFDDFLQSLKIALMTTNPDDPAPNIASVMPLLTFPGTGIYDYAKQKGYFTDEYDYWEKYGSSYLIEYTNYSNEAVGEAVSMANSIYRWKYYQSMADYHIKGLQKRKSRYIAFQYSVARFLKTHPKILKVVSPLLGSKRLEAVRQISNALTDKDQVDKFVDNCFRELLRK